MKLICQGHYPYSDTSHLQSNHVPGYQTKDTACFFSHSPFEYAKYECLPLIPARAKQTPDPKSPAWKHAAQKYKDGFREISATQSGPNHLDLKLVFKGKPAPPPRLTIIIEPSLKFHIVLGSLPSVDKWNEQTFLCDPLKYLSLCLVSAWFVCQLTVPVSVTVLLL